MGIRKFAPIPLLLTKMKEQTLMHAITNNFSRTVESIISQSTAPAAKGELEGRFQFQL